MQPTRPLKIDDAGLTAFLADRVQALSPIPPGSAVVYRLIVDIIVYLMVGLIQRRQVK